MKLLEWYFGLNFWEVWLFGFKFLFLIALLVVAIRVLAVVVRREIARFRAAFRQPETAGKEAHEREKTA